MRVTALAEGSYSEGLYRLKNGLRVGLSPMPGFSSVALGLWVENGSRHEKPENNGISHFIEHMMFKGTRRRTAFQIADEFDAIGGQINAYTSKEYTCFHIRVLKSHLEIGLDILADMFLDSAFSQEDIDKEAHVIVEEINMYEDTPDDLVHDVLQASVWGGNPLGMTILGEKAVITGFTRDVLMSYVKSHYVPGRTLVTAAGNFETGEMLALLERYLGDFGYSGGPGAPAIPEETAAPVYKPCRVVKHKDIEQTHILAAYPGINAVDRDFYPMALFNTIFGGGMSSRLFQRIREEAALAYSVYASNITFKDTGLYSIYAALSPENTGLVLELIDGEIKRIFAERIDAAQLARTKEQLKSNYLMGQESTYGRMSSAARNILVHGRIIPPGETIERIDIVSLDDVYNLAGRLFTEGSMSLAVVGNADGGDIK